MPIVLVTLQDPMFAAKAYLTMAHNQESTIIPIV